jgi:hypothetical protein
LVAFRDAPFLKHLEFHPGEQAKRLAGRELHDVSRQAAQAPSGLALKGHFAA